MENSITIFQLTVDWIKLNDDQYGELYLSSLWKT